jgi:hypothetical protein
VKKKYSVFKKQRRGLEPRNTVSTADAASAGLATRQPVRLTVCLRCIIRGADVQGSGPHKPPAAMGLSRLQAGGPAPSVEFRIKF